MNTSPIKTFEKCGYREDTYSIGKKVIRIAHSQDINQQPTITGAVFQDFAPSLQMPIALFLPGELAELRDLLNQILPPIEIVEHSCLDEAGNGSFFHEYWEVSTCGVCGQEIKPELATLDQLEEVEF